MSVSGLDGRAVWQWEEAYNGPHTDRKRWRRLHGCGWEGEEDGGPAGCSFGSWHWYSLERPGFGRRMGY